MRPSARASLLALSLVAVPALVPSALAQGQPTQVKDSALLHPPAGARVAIITFEDLECPACSHAFPILHQAAEHYKIPLVFYDFPLQMHIWSRDAAVTARYIQDTISPQAADAYRGAVFQNQMSISTKDDLQAFTQKYFQTHGRTMPFVTDPSGRFSGEVQKDYDMGVKIGLNHTPSIFIVTGKGYQEVLDPGKLYETIDAAESSLPAASATPNSKLRRTPNAH